MNNRNAKRVLWLEDMPERYKKSNDFPPYEYHFVEKMDEMLTIIDSEDMLNYDLVVLDINMENGIDNTDAVKKTLEEGGLFFPEDSDDPYGDKPNYYDELKRQGGYFVYLYLLKKGFPSDRICFLTGNSTALNALGVSAGGSRDAEEDLHFLKQTFLSHRYIERMRGAGDDFRAKTALNREIDKDLKEYFVVEKYGTFVSDAVRQLKDQICSRIENDPVQAPGEIYDAELKAFRKAYLEYFENKKEEAEIRPHDILGGYIDRFHHANLKMIDYFAKEGKVLSGEHNWDDFKAWAEERREEKYVVRWLTLFVCRLLLKELDTQNPYRDRDGIIKLSVDDVKSALESLKLVFSDYRRVGKKSFYWHALTVAANPFDKCIPTKHKTYDGRQISTYYACPTAVSKQLRNYCAHNYFAKTDDVDAKEYMFCLLMTVLAFCPKSILERRDLNTWFDCVFAFLSSSDDSKSTDESVSDEEIKSVVYRFVSNHRDIIKQGREYIGYNLSRFENIEKYDVMLDLMCYMGYIKFVGNVPSHYYIFTLYYHVWLMGKQSDKPVFDKIDKYVGERVRALYTGLNAS